MPKGLATGSDGKDFQETFKNGLKPNAKKRCGLGRSEKELGKDQVTIEFLNYDTGNAKKLANILKIRLRKT